ncbi:hypothetical protein PUR_28840 [Paenibacillus sp. URB8-2]|nr:hypothetical protein PUR_28840 [Paenibacillus sp. URB8-2]
MGRREHENVIGNQRNMLKTLKKEIRMTKKKSNTPRHKRLNRDGRLQAAKSWLVKYNGNNKVRGYSKHFAVDLLCAAQELKMLGILVEEKYIKQLEIDKERRIKNNQQKKEKKQLEEYYGQDENDFFEYWVH